MPIHPIQVERIGTPRVGHALEVRSRNFVEGPPFRTMPTGCVGTVERAGALAAVKRGVVTAIQS